VYEQCLPTDTDHTRTTSGRDLLLYGHSARELAKVLWQEEVWADGVIYLS